jgi:tetratricopeptide (TPR) repeat protein
MRVSLLLAVLSTSAIAQEAPVSLTASDGTGLKLVKLQARGVVNDPLAFTELTMTFQNPLPRVLEGQFKVTLPPGATVSRFAMKLDGRWQEGEVVERQAARRAYEDFLHRRQDPALLEQSGGNEFTAKVFPIPANGVKEVVLSYSHELVQGAAKYVLPLKGLPEVAALDVQVSGVQGEGVLQKTRYVPSADFAAEPRHNQQGVRSGDLVVARVVPVEGTDADPLTALTVFVDSSGSRALGWREQTALVQQLLAALAKQAPALTVSVLAFDQEVAPLYAGPAGGFGDAQLKELRGRRALGASNVELALKHLQGKPAPRALFVTDGVMTAGITEGLNLQAQLLKVKAAGVQRIDAVTVGGLRDDAFLAKLTTGALAKDGAVLDGAQAPLELARRLALSTKSKLPVKVAGATATWPTVISGVQAGDAVLIYAQVPAGAPLKVTVGDKAMPVSEGQLASIERPLLERAWAKARIDMLQAQLDRADGPAQREQLKKDIVDLSTKSRVLSSLTALLVLETEADYARFHIDRRALVDVLTVEGGKVTLLKRGPETMSVAKPPPQPEPPSDLPRPAKAEKKKLETFGADEGLMAKADGADQDGEEAKDLAPPRGGAPAEERAAPRPAPADSRSESQPAPRAQAVMPAAPPPPSSGGAPAAERRRMAPREEAAMRSEPRPARAGPARGVDPYTGKFKDVMDGLKADPKKALALAHGWHEEQPGDLLALVALGEALEANADPGTAARAYGSIIDLFPSRADLRRFAGVRLERLARGLEAASDSFAKAAEQRPDHPASHRLLAFSLLRAGRYEQAFEAIKRGLAQPYPQGRFLGVDRILREDAGLIAAAWTKAEPSRRGEILEKLKRAGGTVESEPSLRFILNWETDANDVDFHIYDAKGGHAFYSARQLPSGGELYADVTTGYGPECFTIRLPKEQRAAPYTLQAHYYSIGPMGAGMGKLEIIEHDGKGGLRFEQRPYVVMVNQAFVDLGVVKP